VTPRESSPGGEARRPEGWVPLPAEHLPSPTYWPAGLAAAITFLFWGLIASWVVLAAGAVLFAVSLAGWIREMLHE
jgi:hypothetical protein